MRDEDTASPVATDLRLLSSVFSWTHKADLHRDEMLMWLINIPRTDLEVTLKTT